MTKRQGIDYSPIRLALTGFTGAIVVLATLAYQLRGSRKQLPQVVAPTKSGSTASAVVVTRPDGSGASVQDQLVSPFAGGE